MLPTLEFVATDYPEHTMTNLKKPSKPTALSNFIFASRWLQLPLYLGLILAQAVYVFHFWVELVHLVEAAFGNPDALRASASISTPSLPSPWNA